MVKEIPYKNCAILPRIRSIYPDGSGVLDGIGIPSRPKDESGCIQDQMPGRDRSALGDYEETKERLRGISDIDHQISANDDKCDKSGRCIPDTCGSDLQHT